MAMLRKIAALVGTSLLVATPAVAAPATSAAPSSQAPRMELEILASGGAGSIPGQSSRGRARLDATTIKALKTRDHTEAVRKIRVKRLSVPSRTLWTSTYRTVTVPMLWKIIDPKGVAKKFRVCVEIPLTDEDRCKTHRLRRFAKPRGDFWIKPVAKGWQVYTAPVYRASSPAQCRSAEYYRPKVIWSIEAMTPRSGRTAASAQFSWTVRCSG
jgi:hypothetical protein